MNILKNSLKLTAVLLVTVCALGATSVQAVLIDFEGVAPDGFYTAVGNDYVEKGFNLNNPGDPGDAIIVDSASGFNTTGSDYYGWNNPSFRVNNPITLTNELGLSFDFASLYVGSTFKDSSVSFDITGHLSGGGTVVESVVDVDAFSPIKLGWTNLTSVEFSWVSGEDFSSFGAIDKLDVNVNVSPVPEPTTMLLLGSGLIGLAGFSRKFKKI